MQRRVGIDEYMIIEKKIYSMRKVKIKILVVEFVANFRHDFIQVVVIRPVNSTLQN